MNTRIDAIPHIGLYIFVCRVKKYLSVLQKLGKISSWIKSN